MPCNVPSPRMQPSALPGLQDQRLVRHHDAPPSGSFRHTDVATTRTLPFLPSGIVPETGVRMRFWSRA